MSPQTPIPARTRALPGFASPAAGLDQPFEMLLACHDRVRRSLDLLQRLADHVARHGPDAQAQDAARDVLRYFDLAAPLHHQDEERHVLPRLRASGAEGRAMAARIEADHRRIEALWAALRPALAGWAAGDAGAAMPPGAIEAFVAIHDTHIPLEDGQAFPAARALVDDDALAAMSRDMTARRQPGGPAP